MARSEFPQPGEDRDPVAHPPEPSRRQLLRGAAVLGAAYALGSPVSQAAPTLAAGPIPGLDALALSAAIHAKDISAVEVMQAYLGQIEQIGRAHV